MSKQIILASASPRRQILLSQLGLSYTVQPADIDESWDEAQDTKPADDSEAGLSSLARYAKRVALEKARAVFADADNPQKVLVIGADTCGEIDHQLLSKPNNFDDALAMLQQLSGRTHYIHSAYAVITAEQVKTGVVTSEVTMRRLSFDEIERYWQTGEPCDKAGSYAIQGLGAQFISHLVGSYSAVMGLPLYELASALKTLNIETLPTC